jgi:hypothetical protein
MVNDALRQFRMPAAAFLISCVAMIGLGLLIVPARAQPSPPPPPPASTPAVTAAPDSVAPSSQPLPTTTVDAQPLAIELRRKDGAPADPERYGPVHISVRSADGQERDVGPATGPDVTLSLLPADAEICFRAPNTHRFSPSPAGPRMTSPACFSRPASSPLTVTVVIP